MAGETDALSLIRTKFQRPRLPGDLIPRRRLLDRLHAGLDRKLTLISAQAGAGKTTLLAQWLEECPQPSAWLSLDEHDNDLIVFMSYLIGAIRTVFPDACDNTLGLLNAPQFPPVRFITASLVNELDDLTGLPSLGSAGDHSTKAPAAKGLILALDDYHNITEPAIHEMLSSLIKHLPQGVHLALASRTDPPLPLTGLRARREMLELRSADLRFTSEEAHAFLQATVGRELSSETTALLEEKAEGWVVGLRLAALSMRNLPDDEAFVQRFKGTSSALIVDYLMSEVLAQQSPAIQGFLLQTSILNRFCAALCDAVLDEGPRTKDERPIAEEDEPSSVVVGRLHPHRPASQSRAILEELNAANLFLVPLDEEGRWYRYHHLFRDLLRLRIERRYGPDEMAALHSRASQWFEQNSLVEEALTYAFSAGDMDRAVRIVVRHRVSLLNQAQWQRLDRYLRRFPPQFANQQPDLLMLKTWLLYHQGHWDQLPAALEQIGATLSQTTLPAESICHFKGEISCARSLMSYFRSDVERTIAEAAFSIKNTAPELWIVRILARLVLALALQMRGDLRGAYMAVYRGADEEVVQSNPFRATMLSSVCFIYWIAADLQGLAQVGDQCIELCNYPHSVEIRGLAQYHLGCAYYHQNELGAAEEHFAPVVQQSCQNYGDCFAYSACGLARTYQAQGRFDEARTVASSAVAFMLETGNTTLLPVVQAFQAEIDLAQGHLAGASQWAAQFDSIPPLAPLVRFYEPHLTLIKIWLAQDTPDKRQQAADSLDQLKEYTESTHNTRFLAEVLALQAILQAAEDNEPSALTLLEEAIELAQPGGFIRLFVDLGPPMARLLDQLRRQGVASDYIAQILAAFPEPTTDRGRPTTTEPTGSPSSLIEPLTTRELEVLALLGRHLTNKEIAEELVVSPSTVKTHTLNIYSKLDVRGRQQAVARARDLDILPPI